MTMHSALNSEPFTLEYKSEIVSTLKSPENAKNPKNPKHPKNPENPKNPKNP